MDLPALSVPRTATVSRDHLRHAERSLAWQAATADGMTSASPVTPHARPCFPNYDRSKAVEISFSMVASLEHPAADSSGNGLPIVTNMLNDDTSGCAGATIDLMTCIQPAIV